ncbi:D-glycero-beta-D-manno-heptose-7-phosphate kinase [Desulfurobacterium indicum]|uniref:RfaE bifunctional protein n=1 Tax=Desulfurobacterium indicum TaxID=1914305 RepID=A0A1R1MMS2_9BACT|nr:D-glycero-beta-D-manno-heptose-7-phosphate kinase [Desulfurobacterium indicum]OMH41049.1 rfaE bifunctional protein [Desulfurobacterium indicum]
MKGITEKFKGKKILVIGDLIVDEYIFGKVERISPEAPVPIVEAKNTTAKPGGAANVAVNLKTLGADPFILGVVGKDEKGNLLKKILNEKGINTSLLIEDETRPTTVKTRIIAGSQQLLRVDWESRKYLDKKILLKIIEEFQEDFRNFDGIIISDYGKGVITKELLKAAAEVKKSGKIVTLDPKERNFHFYHDITAMTPNMKETYQATGIYPKTEEEAEIAGKKLIEKFKLDFALITRSEKGMSLVKKDKSYHIPAKAKQVYDVTGAGDTVIAVLTLSLVAGEAPEKAAEIANIAGGIVVGKLGTAAVKPEEIAKAIEEGA